MFSITNVDTIVDTGSPTKYLILKVITLSCKFISTCKNQELSIILVVERQSQRN